MDCIDPKQGGFLREIMEMSAEDIAGERRYCGDLVDARLHWSGCPNCRAEFAGLPPLFHEIGVKLEDNCRVMLSSFRDEFVSQKNSLLAEGNDLAIAYAEVIVELALAEYDVLIWLNNGQAAVNLRPPTAFRKPSALLPSYRGQDSSLVNCQECRDFISSLQPEVQQFVFAVACADDLFMPFREKMRSEPEPIASNEFDDLRYRMDMAIANSGLHPSTLLSVIEKASLSYRMSLGGWPNDDVASGIQTASTQDIRTTQETKPLRGVMQEWKQDFDNLEDSLKAGQMEMMRLYEHNRRSAVAHEPYIAAQLGDPLYSRLHQSTQRALQVVEYLYNINQEPDGFALFAVRMAQGYENELTLRIVWPFVTELLAAGTRTYDAAGISKEPLIRWGKINQRGMTLGSFAWYLTKDPVMRGKVSGRGFDVEAISKDAAWASDVRNKAAHDFTCDRTLADELRRRILSRDGILSRLHPIGGTAADALTA